MFDQSQKELRMLALSVYGIKLQGMGWMLELSSLIDDKGVMEMATIARCHGLVQVNLENPISQLGLVSSPEIRLANGDRLEIVVLEGNV